MRRVRLVPAFNIVLILLLAACSSSAPKPSGETKSAEAKPAFQTTYLTGREALQKMYIAARTWAPDAKPYTLQSIATKEDNGQDGKAGIWGGGFASASKAKVRVFSWSGIKSDDAPEPGVSARPEDTYNPANTSTAVFDMAFVKIDSGGPEKITAFDVAEKHGGDQLIKKDKETKVYYFLVWNARESRLMWRVLFGDQDHPKLAVDVDASTGAFIKVEK